MNIENTIKKTFIEIFEENNLDKVMPTLEKELVLLESGLDSLGFAVLVVRLEESLGFDPFVLSEEPFYPQTLGEFISFYEANKPQ